MPPSFLHKKDLPDADVWITKAALLGIVIRKHQERIDSVAWRYSAIVHSASRIAYGDWPGRCAQTAVLMTQGKKHVDD